MVCFHDPSQYAPLWQKHLRYNEGFLGTSKSHRHNMLFIIYFKIQSSFCFTVATLIFPSQFLWWVVKNIATSACFVNAFIIIREMEDTFVCFLLGFILYSSNNKSVFIFLLHQILRAVFERIVHTSLTFIQFQLDENILDWPSQRLYEQF